MLHNARASARQRGSLRTARHARIRAARMVAFLKRERMRKAGSRCAGVSVRPIRRGQAPHVQHAPIQAVPTERHGTKLSVNAIALTKIGLEQNVRNAIYTALTASAATTLPARVWMGAM